MRVWLAVAGVLLFSCPVVGQSLPEVPPSSTLRIWAPSFALESETAVFVAWEASSLLAVRENSGDTLSLGFSSINRIDLLTGRSAGLGAVGGLGIGGLIGGLVGVLVGSSTTDGYEVLRYTFVGVGVGAVIGGGIGAALGWPGRWIRQTLPPELGFPPATR